MNATSLQSVIDILASLEAGNDYTGIEQIAKASMDGDEFVMQLNEAAAVHLCRLILETASKTFAGAHQHLDQTNFLDSVGVRLRIENVR